MLDPEVGQLQYFVNDQGRSQKPRGSLPLIGASVTTSDEAPHMFVVNSVNGELYKLRGGPQVACIWQSTNTEWSMRVCVLCSSCLECREFILNYLHLHIDLQRQRTAGFGSINKCDLVCFPV